MKFKKYLVLILILILSISLVGCGNQNTEVAVANNLEKNVSKLSTVITTLEDIEYEDIVIDDISPLDSAQTENINYHAENTNTKTNFLQKTKVYQVGNDGTMTINAPKHDQNAKYVSRESEKIDLQKRPQKRLLKNPHGNDIQKTAQNCNNGECETYCKDGKCYTGQNPQYNANNIQSSNNNYNTTRLNNNTSNENNYSTKTKQYKPKYINETSENFTRNQLDKYLQNVENLYDCCADCISCCAEFKIEEAKLMQNMKDCKTYCSKLRDGTITLTENEISKCNQCLQNLSSCIARLKSTKGNLKNKTLEIESLKDNFGNKLTDLKTAYEKLYNALDNRLEYVKECNQNINCIFDIINKTNVNVKEAEKNKSNEEDIIHNQEMLENENRERENTEYFDNTTLNNNESQDNYRVVANQTKSNNKTKNQTNKPKKITRVVKENVNNNQDVYNRNLSQQTQNTTPQPILNNNPNYVNNGYGYGYPNGYYGPVLPYGNNPAYPPRNIDTYRYITKNTDTYRPNYVPNTNQNGLNNNTQNTETYIIEEETDNQNNDENNNKKNENVVETNTNFEPNLSTTNTSKNDKTKVEFLDKNIQKNNTQKSQNKVENINQNEVKNQNQNSITKSQKELKSNQNPVENQENAVKNDQNDIKNDQNDIKNYQNTQNTENNIIENNITNKLENDLKIKKTPEEIKRENEEKINKYGYVKPIIEELKNN